MLKIAFFSSHQFERSAFETANARYRYELRFFDTRLSSETAPIARGFDVVCAFVNDRLDQATITILQTCGVRLIALRSAGFNHVDLQAAAACGIPVVRVPAYSPHAIAEHAILLALALNRKICRANARVREHNFSLDGLVGFDFNGKTVGIVGTGQIGSIAAGIFRGFGCRILAYDIHPDLLLQEKHQVRYVSLEELYRESDIISLHVPLSEKTLHLIDQNAFQIMKPGVMLINTGRGGLVNAKALLTALKTGRVGAAGLDVYEEEENYFFRDLSEEIIQDDVLARLLTFPNVLITAHQAFLTHEALDNIATTTLENIREFELGKTLTHQVRG